MDLSKASPKQGGALGYVPSKRTSTLSLAPPRPQRPAFRRPAALEYLQAPPRPALIGLFGGPGLAKTSLLAELWRAQGGAMAWVGLGRVEDWPSLSAWLQLALGRALPGLPQLPEGLPPRHWVACMAAEVEALAPEGLALALDDLPLTPACQEGLEALLASWPGWLGISCRQRPEGLGWAALEAKGTARALPPELFWLSEEEEAACWAEFRPQADPQAWRRQTQGWPLALAFALSQVDGQRQDLSTHLGPGWWDQLSPGLRQALRLGAWGDTLKPQALGRAWAQVHGPAAGQALEAELEAVLQQGHLPASPLDPGTWALPQALLDFLRSLPPPSREASLALANTWEQQGEAEAALTLCLELGAWSEGSAWLQGHGALALAEGRLGQLRRWLDAFPVAWRHQDPTHQVLQGEWLRRSGQGAEAQALLQSLAQRRDAGPWALGRARLGLAALKGSRGDQDFVAAAVAAWKAVPQDDRLGQAEAANLRAAAALYAGKPLVAAAAFEGAAAWAQESKAPGLAAKATQNFGLALLAQGRVQAAISAYQRAIALAEAAQLPSPPMAWANLAWALCLSGAWAPAAQAVELAVAGARTHHQGRALGFAQWAEGKRLGMLGRWPEARLAMAAALEAGQANQDRGLQVDGLGGLAWCSLAQAGGRPSPGLRQEAWDWIRQGEALAQAPWHHPSTFELLRPATWLLLAEGRPSEAIEGLKSLLGHPQLHSPPKRAQALALLAQALGQPEGEEAMRLARAMASAQGLDGLFALFPAADGSPAALRPPGQASLEAQAPPMLDLALLGPPCFRLSDRPFSPPKWASSRGPALLCFLSLHPHGVTREQLEAAFLGSGAGARSGVATMIQRLRLALEPELTQAAASRFVLLEAGRYRLAKAPWVDSDLQRAEAALRQAEALPPGSPEALSAWRLALAWHRGPLAEGLEGDWLEAEREAWRRRWGQAHQAYILGLMDADAGPEAVAAAEAYLKLDPLHEEALMRLVEALDAVGRRAEAAQALRAFEQAWGKGMGGLPLPSELQDLLRQWGGPRVG